jgi:K+-transporting ATPase ATPase C chain
MNINFRPLLSTFLFLAVTTGLAYPLLVTAVAQAFFPFQANGSLIEKNGKTVGSRLIGQNFNGEGYFWGRPSATATYPYNSGLSGGSNLGPLNPALLQATEVRVQTLRAADPGNHAPVPVDLATASASGLDPHISLASARYQLTRVAHARGLPPDAVDRLISAHTEPPLFDLAGAARVNVLELNLALDHLKNP